MIFQRRRPAALAAGAELDKKLVYSLSRSKIPNLRQLKHLRRTLGRREKRLLNFLIIFIILNLAWISFGFARGHLRVVPVFAGQYSEALIGQPAHINPWYAPLNDADRDISRLVYSSLFKYDENGQLVKDLTEDYQVSADGKTYLIKIRDDAKWHNGEKLTADDVVFTFQALTDPAYNSPLRAAFADVNISKSDERTIAFSLSAKYAPFLGLLTFGIMPESVWGQIAPSAAFLAEANLKPIGSGPYEFKSLTKDKSGDIKIYTLSANRKYYGAKPFIKEIVFKFYSEAGQAAAALNDNTVDGLPGLAKEDAGNLIAKNSLNLFKLAQPRLKAVFFNPDKNASLKDVKVRQALSFATPRREIIDQAMSGEAKPIYGPIMDNNFAYKSGLEKYDLDLARAASLLDAAGWKKETVTAEEIAALQEKKAKATSSKDVLTDEEKRKIELGAGAWLYHEPAPAKTTSAKTPAKKTAVAPAPLPKIFLTVNLTIIDNDEDAKIAELIRGSWEKLGVKVGLIKVPVKEIQTGADKPKNYEALLFSQLVGADPDAYVFWDSTQAGAGGLNLSNYKNEEADKALEEGRLTANRDERIADYQKFQELLNADAPAVFLFSPYYTYAQNKKIKGFAVKSIVSPADRFTDVSAWYLKTGERLEW